MSNCWRDTKKINDFKTNYRNIDNAKAQVDLLVDLIKSWGWVNLVFQELVAPKEG